MNFRKSKRINNIYTDPLNGFTFTETSKQNAKIRLPFVGGLGLEKTHEDGGISYCGLSYHFALKPTVQGKMELVDNGQIQSGYIDKRVFYWSIDVKYIPGKKRRFGKAVLPERIYSPRFL